MKFEPRYKFSASLDAVGDITPGAAINGYLAHTLATDAVGFHVLLEQPSTNAWQLCLYNPNATAGSRRTMIHESAGTPFATVPMSGLIASLIAPETAYVASSSATVSPIVDSLYSLAVGGSASVSASSIESVAVGVTAESRATGSTALGYGAIAQNAYSVMLGNGTFSDGDYSTVVGYQTKADTYALGGASSGVNLFGSKAWAALVGETSFGSVLRPQVSFVPIRAVAGVAAAAGTYALESFDGEGNSSTVTGTLVRSSGGGTLQGVRVQGTIVCTATTSTNNRVFDVDYYVTALPSAAVSYSTFTAKYTGGAGTLTLAVSSAGALTITTGAAYAGLKVTGNLMVTKIVY